MTVRQLREGKGRLGKGRPASRLIRRAVLVVVISSLAVADGGIAAASSKHHGPSKVVNYGSFKFTGTISGVLAAVSGTCAASASAPDVQFIWYGKVKSLKGISPKSIVTLELDLLGAHYGKGKLTNNQGNPPFLNFGATVQTGTAVNWQSVSGTYSTNKNGTSGSVDVLLEQVDGSPGRTTIDGTWQHCS